MNDKRFQELITRAKEQNLTEYEKKALIHMLSEMPSIKRNSSIMCCPFHEEKTPSFAINRDDKTFRCFSCGVTGGLVIAC